MMQEQEELKVSAIVIYFTTTENFFFKIEWIDIAVEYKRRDLSLIKECPDNDHDFQI